MRKDMGGGDEKEESRDERCDEMRRRVFPMNIVSKNRNINFKSPEHNRVRTSLECILRDCFDDV
jgi:hypothetical protein